MTKISKTSRIVALVLGLATAQASEWRTVQHRDLAQAANATISATAVDTSEFGTLVSGIVDDKEWCITASNGVDVGSSVGFRLCDGSDDQQWTFVKNKWRSMINPSRCIAVESGKASEVEFGARLRMTACPQGTTFAFATDGEKHLLQVKSNTNYCVTNQGSTPEATDVMILGLCSGARKKQQFRYETPYQYIGYTSYTTPRGCLQVKGQNAVAGQPIILGDCSLNHRWRHGSNGLFHSELNDNMCMEAVPPSGKGIGNGVPMVLNPCKASNANQHFVENPGVTLQLEGYDALCVSFQGQTPDIGKDRIVLEYCDSDEVWSFDG